MALETVLLRMVTALGVALGRIADDIKLGTVGDWVSGIVASAAIIATVWLALSERSDRRAAERRERAADQRAMEALDRERTAQQLAALEHKEAQARRVVGWLSHRRGGPEDKEYGEALPPLLVRVATVLNGSDAPVFKVLGLYVPFGDGHTSPIFEEDVMPPGPAIESTLDRSLPQGGLVLQFQDLGGRWWQRGLDGELRQVTEDNLWAP